MLPDVSGLDRPFDYEVPTSLAAAVSVGSIVRVELRHRKVRAWVIALSGGAWLEMPPGAGPLKRVVALVSAGPAPEVVDLARWAAWRYAGRLRAFLLAASPDRVVRPGQLEQRAEAVPTPDGQVAPPTPNGRVGPPTPVPAAPSPATAASPAPPADPVASVAAAVAAGLGAGAAWLRLPPASPRLAVIEAVIEQVGSADGVLVLVPERNDAELLQRLLARRRLPAAVLPQGWRTAAAGGQAVIGARAGAFGPMPTLRAAVVLDAHDESYVETRAPTWSAPVVLAERARRAGAALLLVSPCPPLGLAGLAGLGLGAQVRLDRSLERAGWPAVEVLDRRRDDPRSGRYSPRLAELIRAARRNEPDLPVVCVLNRTGRVRLLACADCGEVARCEQCGAALHEPTGGELACPACGASRAAVCATCASARLKRLRVGASRAREELAALTGLEVDEVTSASPASAARQASQAAADPQRGTVLVGTEAVLRRVRRASLVVMLDLDQELLAPRFRAAEQAFVLLARAARLLGGRSGGSAARLVLQTRLPEHEVVRAATLGAPGIFEDDELERRRRQRLPPYSALAVLSGRDAAELAARLRSAGLEVGPVLAAHYPEGSVLVRATAAPELADALAGAESTTLDVRVEVDPLQA